MMLIKSFRDKQVSLLSFRLGNLIPVIGLMSRVFTSGLRDWGSIPGRVIPKSHKMVLDSALLNAPYSKVRIKLNNPGNGVAPFLTCSSYWKESLRVILDNGRQLYFLIVSYFLQQYIFPVTIMSWQRLNSIEKSFILNRQNVNSQIDSFDS